MYCRRVTVIKKKFLLSRLRFEKWFQRCDSINNDFCSIKFRVIIDEKLLTLKKTLIDFYSKQFNDVFFKEMNEHKRINTYKRMKQFNLFNNVKILSSRLIFKVKKNLHDEIKKFKIRWCVRKCEQIHDIDFNDIYVSVIKTMTYKIIFIIIAHHNLNVEQMNIITFFLNVIFKKRNVFIEFSSNFEISDYVWILIRVLYDLKQFFRE